MHCTADPYTRPAQAALRAADVVDHSYARGSSRSWSPDNMRRLWTRPTPGSPADRAFMEYAPGPGVRDRRCPGADA